MYDYNEIKTVHLEMTERCNASCPQCGRNINGGETNPYLKDRELDLISIQKIFPEKFIKQLTHIYMCGNYGDPIVAKDTLEAFRYFREVNKDIRLSMNTNGSARTEEWWKELASILKPNGHVIFSIDGLEDTNHKYRRNTNWDKIISNVEAFINAGGNAHWEFIVFQHNEHQVEEARELSIKLGFKYFQVKKTARFFSSMSGQIKQGSVIVDRKGNKIELQMPQNPEYLNEGLKQLRTEVIPIVTLPTTYEEIKDKLGPELFNSSIIESYDKTEIDCKVKKEKNLYISAEGLVMPCCWMASTVYSWHHMHKRTQIWKYINKVGIDKINAHNYTIEEILDGDFFNMVQASWELPTCSQGKLTVCAKTCGKDLETFSKQYA
jgi:MoaA/NifB/PqqE/SkfB family radical SAM enzyme